MRAPGPSGRPSRGGGAGRGSRCRRGSPRRGRRRCRRARRGRCPAMRRARRARRRSRGRARAARSRVGRSSGSVSSTTTSTKSGVVPFQMPASTDDTCCSPNANSVNGALLTSAAATTEMGPGARVARKAPALLRAAPAVSASRPKSMRPNETCTGVKPRLPILMSTNDMPQIAPSSRSRAGHAVARRLTRPRARGRAGRAWPRARRHSR